MPITLNGNGSITGYTPAASSISGALGTSNMPAGSIVQVKHVKDTSSGTWSQSGVNIASFADVPGLSLNMTLTDSANSVLVLAHCCFSENSTDYCILYRVLRDSTVLGGVTTNNRTPISFAGTAPGSYMDDKTGSTGFSYVDTPGTDQQMTYKVTALNRHSPDNWAYNRAYDSNNDAGKGQGVSTLTCLEIKV
tara:strand:- start:2102 stop:2680 length:579 start_codon:yes stop_codon:yes gene_type:complete